MKKLKSKRKLKAQVWKLFSKYIRLRDCLRTTGSPDWGKCITCKALTPFKEGDAGHFIQGRLNSILFDETCTHFQCRSCNRFRGGEPLKYRREIEKLYGEGYDLILEERAMPTKTFSIEELEQLKETYKQKIKQLGGTE